MKRIGEMAEASSSRLKTDHPSSDSDILSNLPKHVIEDILKWLPLRDIVRTRRLSRAWRDGLSAVPQVIFDRASFPRLQDQDQDVYDNKLVRIIDQVFQLHRGKINNFELSVGLTCNPALMDTWVHHLSSHPVEKFTLKIRKGSRYKLPLSFFLIKKVTSLELFRCIFNPPSSFNGYKKLTSLYLSDVVFTEDEIERLLKLCPLLAKLHLKNVECDSLRINNEKLVELSVDSRECKHMNLYVESAPLLADVWINVSCSDGVRVDNSNLVDLLGNVPSIRNLTLMQDALKQLFVGNLSVDISSLHMLRHLSIGIDFGEVRQLFAAYCILQNSPVLEDLDIKALEDPDSTDDFSLLQEDFDCKLTHLKTARMSCFGGSECAIDFIKFILVNAPLLETMEIEVKVNIPYKEAILMELLCLPRSSVKARILINEHVMVFGQVLVKEYRRLGQ